MEVFVSRWFLIVAALVGCDEWERPESTEGSETTSAGCAQGMQPASDAMIAFNFVSLDSVQLLWEISQDAPNRSRPGVCTTPNGLSIEVLFVLGTEEHATFRSARTNEGQITLPDASGPTFDLFGEAPPVVFDGNSWLQGFHSVETDAQGYMVHWVEGQASADDRFLGVQLQVALRP
jgi:hypothetical protein